MNREESSRIIYNFIISDVLTKNMIPHYLRCEVWEVSGIHKHDCVEFGIKG